MCIRDRWTTNCVPSAVSCTGRKSNRATVWLRHVSTLAMTCLLYTSDAADERSSVDLGGRRIIKKKTNLAALSRIIYALLQVIHYDEPDMYI